jgi:hypothetical protein
MSTVTTVSSVTLHLAKPIENPILASVMTSLITGEDMVAIKLRDSIKTYTKMPQAFQYAKDYYTLALPTGKTSQTNTPTKAEIESRIETEIAYPLGVLVSEFIYRTYEPYFEVLDYLLAERDFDITTATGYNYFSLDFTASQQLKLVGSAISVDGLSVIIDYEYWGNVEYNPGDGPIYYQFEKISEHTEVVVRPSTTNTTYNDPCLIAWYQKLNAVGVPLATVYYWIYRISSNQYPELDNSLTTTASTEYLPVIPLRYNNQDLTGQAVITLQDQIASLPSEIAAVRIEYDAAYAIDLGLDIDDGTGTGATIPPPSWTLAQTIARMEQQLVDAQNDLANQIVLRDTDLYKTSKKLLSILDIPMEQLGTNLNSNPSITDIDHAYVMFGADLQSEEECTIAYLNHYFDYLGSINTSTYASTTLDPLDTTGSIPYDTGVFTEHGLTLSMSIESIETTYVTGDVGTGKIGNASKVITYTNYPATGDESTFVDAYTEALLTLDLQVATDTIRRVVVKNLSVTNHIDGNYTVTTTLDQIKDDVANHNMIIPIEYEISLLLPIMSRHDLYLDCTLLVVNSIVKQKLKWYEETWFAAAITFIGFVIAVWTGQAWVAELALYVAETTALLITILVMISISVVLKLTASWLIREFGLKVGGVLATILAVAAIVLGQGKAGIEILTKYTIYYAQLALQAAQAIISSANEFIHKGTQKIVEEYSEFSKLLVDAYDAIDTNIEIQAIDNRAEFDPLAFTRPKRYYSIPNETPAEFFNRTIDLPNNTFYGIHDAVPNFVSNLLAIDKNTVMSRA